MTDLINYRLEEIHDDAQRKHLFRDLEESYPALRLFLTAVDVALTYGSEEHREALAELQAELEGVREDLYIQEATNDDLRSDLAYWREQALGAKEGA